MVFSPLIRQRILQGTNGGGFMNVVEVDRPTILDPYGDPNYGPVTTDSNVKGFWVAYGFPSRGVSPLEVDLIPAKRGRVYLWAPGRWIVRVETQTAGPQSVYFREIGVENPVAASWFLDEDDYGTPNRFAKRNRDSGSIPTTGQTFLFHIRETIEAREIAIRFDTSTPGVAGVWIAVQAPSHFGALADSWFFPMRSEPYFIPRHRLPIGDVRARSEGGNAVLHLMLTARSDVPT